MLERAGQIPASQPAQIRRQLRPQRFLHVLEQTGQVGCRNTAFGQHHFGPTNVIDEKRLAVTGNRLRQISKMIPGVFKTSFAACFPIALFEFWMTNEFPRHHLRRQLGTSGMKRFGDPLVQLAHVRQEQMRSK
ncbi:MAG: hypothetical protein ABSA83_16015 [Verrucomicrobiota bacterium]